MKQFFTDMWTNHKKEVISAITLIIVLGLLLSQCGSGNSANSLPGGGAGMLIIATLLVVGAVVNNSTRLFLFSLIFWTIWLYPKVMSILSLWGVVPSFAFLLFLGMVWWIVKRGNGRFGYRLIIATVLLFSVVGMSDIVNKGIAELKKVEIPKIPFPSIAPDGSIAKIIGAGGKMADAYASRVDATAAKEIVVARQHSQIQKIWRLPLGKRIYNNNNGNLIPLLLKYEKDVVALSLNNSIEINGAIYEEVGLPDPLNGQPGKVVGWVFSVDLVEITPPEEKPLPDLAEKLPQSKKVGLIDTVRITSSFPRSTRGFLPPGKYELKFEPAEAAVGATLLIKFPDGKSKSREIKNNRVSIQKGEKGRAIGSPIFPSIAQIYYAAQ